MFLSVGCGRLFGCCALQLSAASADTRLEQHGLHVNYAGVLLVCVNRMAEGIQPYADTIVGLLTMLFNTKGSTAHEDAFQVLGALATRTSRPLCLVHSARRLTLFAPGCGGQSWLKTL